MKIGIIVSIFLVILGGYIVFTFITEMIPSPEEQREGILRTSRDLEYSGVVTNKFIDKKEHNFRKVVIQENGQKRTILYNFENGGLFDFISINDSIIKTEGNLKVQIIRSNLDTVINMSFSFLKTKRHEIIHNED